MTMRLLIEIEGEAKSPMHCPRSCKYRAQGADCTSRYDCYIFQYGLTDDGEDTLRDEGCLEAEAALKAELAKPKPKLPHGWQRTKSLYGQLVSTISGDRVFVGNSGCDWFYSGRNGLVVEGGHTSKEAAMSAAEKRFTCQKNS